MQVRPSFLRGILPSIMEFKKENLFIGEEKDKKKRSLKGARLETVRYTTVHKENLNEEDFTRQGKQTERLLLLPCRQEL